MFVIFSGQCLAMRCKVIPLLMDNRLGIVNSSFFTASGMKSGCHLTSCLTVFLPFFKMVFTVINPFS